MKYTELKEEIFNKAKDKFDDYEIFINNINTSVVSTYNEQLNKYTISESGGISFRGIKGNMEGYAYSENVSKESIDYLIDMAYQSMIAVGEKEEIFIYKPNQEEKINIISQKSSISSDKKIEKILSMYDLAKLESEEVHQLDGQGVEIFEDKYIANSHNLEKYEENSYSYAYAYVILKRNGEMKSGMEFAFKDNFMDCDFEYIAKSAVKKAEREFGAKAVDSGKYDIVILNEEISSLLGSLSPAFSAKNVQKKMSPLEGMLGEVIASDKLTIRDLRSLPETNVIESFDDEGIETKDLEIIKNGKLLSYVHNMETASKDGIDTTANASRSYKSVSSPSIRNMVIDGGTLDFEGLLRKMNNGLLITSLQGLHSGLDPVSGVFSLPCNGFLVENGEIKRAVNQIILSSNLKEFIKSIDEVGTDRRITLDGSYVASMLVKNISISGI
ncbi:MAG: metallopeptidase TldD-related protein [Peptostreptococcus sp.]|uniref:TldD/PmbA family protein n=1 Tax=Peptostreptococcus sp. TaxID=1262 RepID=UPI002FCC6872